MVLLVAELPRSAAPSRGAYGAGVLAIVALLSGCGASAAAPAPRPQVDCDRLDSQLRQLVRASDAQAFASSASLDLDRDGVLVTIKLRSGATAPSGHGLHVRATFADLVDARVPPSELCALAAEPSVVAVMVPSRPLPDEGRP